jgi:hypothetical protein
MRCPGHRPGNAIILGFSVPGDQRQCHIARVPLRVVAPIFGAELLDFRAQAIGINRQWQANEGLRELHVPCDDRRIATIGQILEPEMQASDCITRHHDFDSGYDAATAAYSRRRSHKPRGLLQRRCVTAGRHRRSLARHS